MNVPFFKEGDKSSYLIMLLSTARKFMNAQLKYVQVEKKFQARYFILHTVHY